MITTASRCSTPAPNTTAARGYAVLQGNPRGSSGRTLAFGAANQNDWGGKDFVDIMKGVDHVIKMGVADSTQLAVLARIEPPTTVLLV